MIEQALKEAGIEVEGLFALEAGTGAGETTEYLAEHGVRKVISISIEREHLKEAKEEIPHELHDRIVFLEADLRAIPIRDDIFDLATAHFLLNVTPVFNGLTILREIHRVLRRGGKLVIVDYAPFDEATSSTSWIHQEIWRLENALAVLLTGRLSYTEYPGDWLVRQLETIGFRGVEYNELWRDVPWDEELLEEHAEIIIKDLKRLEPKSPELSTGFKKRLEELLQASQGVEVCSGSIYAVYAEKG
jgi:SAM-dependent methyltransferase